MFGCRSLLNLFGYFKMAEKIRMSEKIHSCPIFVNVKYVGENLWVLSGFEVVILCELKWKKNGKTTTQSLSLYHTKTHPQTHTIIFSHSYKRLYWESGDFLLTQNVALAPFPHHSFQIFRKIYAHSRMTNNEKRTKGSYKNIIKWSKIIRQKGKVSLYTMNILMWS